MVDRLKLAAKLSIFLMWMSRFVGMSFDLRFDRRTEICEPIKIPMCEVMPYNMTRMPNLLHHSTQENAELAIDEYEILIKQNCSDILLFFLCAMYTPICTVDFQPDAIPPCRGVCERARAGCEPLMNKHNVSWPEPLDCAHLPSYDRGVCVSPEAIIPSTIDKPVLERSEKPADRKDEQKKEREEPEEREERENTEDCTCPQQIHPSKKVYRKGKYHYAIRGRVVSVSSQNNQHTTIHVTVQKILKSGTVTMEEGKDVTLWSNTTCLCPPLTKRREYLIIGHEDKSSSRLLYLHKSLVTRWRDKWEKSFKKWDRKKKRKGKRKDKSKRKNKNGSGRDKNSHENESDKKAKGEKRQRGKERKKQKENKNKKSRSKRNVWYLLKPLHSSKRLSSDTNMFKIQ